MVWEARWGILLTAFLVVATQAQEKVEGQQESRQAVLDHLSSLDGVRLGKRLQLQPLEADDLRKIFERCDFLLLRYPRYPIEVVPVEPLRANNLFAVCDGRVTRISDETALKNFFLQHFPASANSEMRAAGVRGWLRLVQELYQDGFVQFGSPSIKAGDSRFEGAVNATDGSGEGKLTVTMEFKSAKLSKLISEGQIVPGPRQLR
jgi:hypothetical protein